MCVGVGIPVEELVLRNALRLVELRPSINYIKKETQKLIFIKIIFVCVCEKYNLILKDVLQNIL